MKISYSKQALKEIEGLRDPVAVKGLVRAIRILEEVENLHSLAQVKALAGGGGYFRMRIGNYRMGMRMADEANDGVLLLRVMHRREIYRHFPPK